MICSKCEKKTHARGLCRRHYTAWYRANGEIASREGERYRAKRYWKFTAQHWWSWWEKRTPDIGTLELRARIEDMRHTLP